MRRCTICLEDINPKENRHVIAIKSFKYYRNYNRNLTRPTQRREHVWCPECTNWFAKVLEERIKELDGERMAFEERIRLAGLPCSGGEVHRKRGERAVS